MSMTRRNFLKYTAGASSLLAMGRPLSFGQSRPAANRPNIILVYLDDLGYGDFSCYGGDIPTPHIDSVARQGIRFTDFYVSFPACTPSRYSLLTGCYPGRARNGLHNVLMPGSGAHFDPCEKKLPEFLKPAGYASGIFGKWHLGSKEEAYLPMHQGFDVFCGHLHGCIDYFTHVYGPLGNVWYVNNVPKKEEGYSTDLITDHAIAFMERSRKNNQPFLAYIPYNAPHYGKTDAADVPEGTLSLEQKPYKNGEIINSLQAPKEYLDRFAHVENIYRRYYSAMVSSVDDNIGKIIEYLTQNNLMENTMIWIMSDNGGYSITFQAHASNGPLRGQKGRLYEGGIRVPGIVCWKGKIAPNQTLDQVVGNVDIVPTLAAITGVSESLKGLPIDGIDVSDVLFKGTRINRDLFWQKEGTHAMRRNEWKMVNGKELYNLATDLEEKKDLAAQYPEKLAELNAAYQKFADGMAKYPCKCPGGESGSEA